MPYLPVFVALSFLYTQRNCRSSSLTVLIAAKSERMAWHRASARIKQQLWPHFPTTAEGNNIEILVFITNTRQKSYPIPPLTTGRREEPTPTQQPQVPGGGALTRRRRSTTSSTVRCRLQCNSTALYFSWHRFAQICFCKNLIKLLFDCSQSETVPRRWRHSNCAQLFLLFVFQFYKSYCSIVILCCVTWPHRPIDVELSSY